MKQSTSFVPILDLSIRQFIEKTNKDRPEITGGCVLLTNASITAVMVLMALRISMKKAEEPAEKRFLKKQIRAISKIQVDLSEAAEYDLRTFDEYRKLLRSRSKDRGKRLDIALSKATDSLLNVCKLLHLAVQHTELVKSYTHRTVRSDVEAALLILNALKQSMIALADGNVASLPESMQANYEQLKQRLQQS